jgi:hypothetical protein
MPRPLNKTQLLEAAQKEYRKLELYLSSLTPGQITTPTAPGEWSVKDILAHLYEWQQMFFRWYEAGLRGKTPAVPAPGYKWSQLPALNQAIYEKYLNLPLDEVLALFRESHQKTVELMESLSDADLTTPGLYSWMNQNTLISYLNSITAAHFVWAMKECKKAVRPAGAKI